MRGAVRRQADRRRPRSRSRKSRERLRPARLAAPGLDLPETIAQAPARRPQLALELGELVPAPANQLELLGDVAERLVEDLAAPHWAVDAPSPLATQGRPRVLGGYQLLQLVEGDSEQLLQPQKVANSLHRLLVVHAVPASPALGGRGQQSDLLVVADRPGGGPGHLRHVADPQPGLGLTFAHAASSERTPLETWGGLPSSAVCAA